jgi:hypothetical protein
VLALPSSSPSRSHRATTAQSLIQDSGVMKVLGATKTDVGLTVKMANCKFDLEYLAQHEYGRPFVTLTEEKNKALGQLWETGMLI